MSRDGTINCRRTLTALKPKLNAMMDDARSRPEISQELEVFAFVEKARANLKAQEENSASGQEDF
jgi:hypothetical protein